MSGRPTRAGTAGPRVTLRVVAVSLAAGGIGGWLANLVQIPLPWMIGAMAATTVLAVPGIPLAVPAWLRSVMVAVLGVMLGSGFTPDIAEHIADWGVSIGALAFYCAAAGAAGYVYFRRVCGYDPPTAYFSAMPGGLAEMVLVGTSVGGDVRVISLTHASRILLVVMALPFAFQILVGYESGDRPPMGMPILTLDPVDLAILAVCAVVGLVIARKLRIPAAALVGPLILSAAVHLAGWTAARPPLEIVALAQVVVGTAVGCRFVGAHPVVILRTMIYAVGGTFVLMLTTLAFALSIAQITGLSREALILAYSPGGLAEMSLIAIAISADSALVATHHIVRVFLIVVAAPWAYRLLRRTGRWLT